MADVTINELTPGTPAGNNLVPYSTGLNTLRVPVSALFQGTSNIGIGTATPGATLDISAGVINGSHVGPSLRLTNGFTDQGAGTWVPNTDYAGSVDYYTVDGSGGGGGAGPNVISFIKPYVQTTVGQGWSLAFGVSTVNEPATERMRIANTGNVGIGTAAPAERLTVMGNMSASGDVKASNTPKAWVNFDGINGSTVGGEFRCNIFKNYNINRVVRTTTGRYTVYFTTAAPDAYYVTTGACNYNNANDDNLTIFTIGSQYTSYCQVVSRGYGSAAGYYNPSSMQVLIHY